MNRLEVQLIDFVSSSGGDVQCVDDHVDCVYLNHLAVVDEDLRAFDQGPLPHLKLVDISGTKVSDRGLIYFTKQTQLHTLRVGYTGINGLGFQRLDLPNLKTLYLRGCPHFSDDGSRQLSFRSLEELWLNETGIDDRSLAHVGKLHSLKRLWLDRTKITNDGLPLLYDLTNLEILSTNNTSVTSEGLSLLHQRLPFIKPQLQL